MLYFLQVENTSIFSFFQLYNEMVKLTMKNSHLKCFISAS